MRRLLLARLFAYLLALLLAGLAQAAAAAELRPFTAASLPAIGAQFAGRPFVLVLWSLDCHYCAAELRTLGRLRRADRQLAMAIVSTDTPAQADEIRAALEQHGLGAEDTWVFADAVPERLRRAIDPVWRGELPRSYLFDAAHRAEAHSGRLDEARLRAWLDGRARAR